MIASDPKFLESALYEIFFLLIQRRVEEIPIIDQAATDSGFQCWFLKTTGSEIEFFCIRSPHYFYFKFF